MTMALAFIWLVGAGLIAGSMRLIRRAWPTGVAWVRVGLWPIFYILLPLWTFILRPLMIWLWRVLGLHGLAWVIGIILLGFALWFLWGMASDWWSDAGNTPKPKPAATAPPPVASQPPATPAAPAATPASQAGGAATVPTPGTAVTPAAAPGGSPATADREVERLQTLVRELKGELKDAEDKAAKCDPPPKKAKSSGGHAAARKKSAKGGGEKPKDPSALAAPTKAACSTCGPKPHGVPAVAVDAKAVRAFAESANCFKVPAGVTPNPALGHCTK